MFANIGNIFALLVLFAIACICLALLIDTIKEKRDKTPDIFTGGYIKVSIGGGKGKFYMVDETVLHIGDEINTQGKDYIKGLDLTPLTDEDIEKIITEQHKIK